MATGRRPARLALAVSLALPCGAGAGSLGWGRLLSSKAGCRDEIQDCQQLGAALWNPEGECRYPAAEQCLQTCGLCWRAVAARRCQTPIHSCQPFCSTRIDWVAFLEEALARQELAQPGLPRGRLLSRAPPLIEVPGFLSPAEADGLTAVAEQLGFEPEEALPRKIRDVDKVDCEDPQCLFHPLVGEVYRRTAELLGVPAQNFESLEFLRYGPGQHYKTHPDTSQEDLGDAKQTGCGLRVLTVFLYLSDVEEGGATSFPHAGLKVRPAKGKIVVWSNVQADFWRASRAAEHRALPVRRGRKLGANFWVHALDVRSPEKFSPEAC